MSEPGALEALISSYFGTKWHVQSEKDSSGRRKATLLAGPGHTVFVKYTNPPHALSKARCEAEALRRMASVPGVRTPDVIGCIEMPAGRAALVLKAVDARDPASATSADWEMVAGMVAALHRTTDTHFGLDHDNFIGDFDQTNTRSSSWNWFFAECRLKPMLNRLKESGEANAHELDLLWRFVNDEESLPTAPVAPSLLHGDLWPGNVLFDERGAVLIDPAVSFGNREMDLAFGQMSPHLRFPDAFYARYESLAPLQPGHERRARLWQLWPLLAHVIQDGRGKWMPRVLESVKRYRQAG